MAQRGRPSDYDPEIASEVCLRISIDSLGLRAVCDSDERFPDPATFYRWMLSRAELREIYTRAKDDQLQVLADEIQQIADEPQPGEIVTLKGDEREVKIADMLEHRKLRIESRKWLLAKLAPKKYGEKLAIGGDPDGTPVQVVVHRGQKPDAGH